MLSWQILVPAVSDMEDERKPLVQAPPAKKRYSQNYRKEWEAEAEFIGWLRRSEKGAAYGYCSICNKHIKVAAGGKADIRDHGKGERHRRLLSERAHSTPKLPPFVSFDNGVAQAELMWAYTVAEQRLPFTLSNSITELFPVMFNDSKIASQFSCNESKAKALVVNVIGEELRRNIVEKMKASYFSILLSECTNHPMLKWFALVVRLIDNSGLVKTYFYKLVELKSVDFMCSKQDEEILLKTIMNHLDEDEVPAKQIVGLGLSKALAEENNIYPQVKVHLPHTLTAHYVYHAAHCVADEACNVFDDNIQALPGEIWYYVTNYAHEVASCALFENFVEVKPQKLLIPNQKRWISIHKVVTLLTENWRELKLHFERVCEASASAMTILSAMKSELTHLCFLFLNYALPVLLEFNLLFVQESPNIDVFHQELQLMYRKLLCKFIKPHVIKESGNACNIDVEDPCNHLPQKEVGIGRGDCRALLKHLESEGEEQTVFIFLSVVQRFWVDASLHLQRTMPLKDDDSGIYGHLAALSPGNCSVSRHSFLAMAERFPNVIEPSEATRDDLEDETLEYELLTIPDEKMELPLDQYWNYIKVLRPANTKPLTFPLLGKLASAMLVLPHSDAEAERVFREVHKTIRQEGLSMECNFLEALLHVSLNGNQTECFKSQTFGDALRLFHPGGT